MSLTVPICCNDLFNIFVKDQGQGGQSKKNAKVRVFLEALTQVSFSGGVPFFAGKMHGYVHKAP